MLPVHGRMQDRPLKNDIIIYTFERLLAFLVILNIYIALDIVVFFRLDVFFALYIQTYMDIIILALLVFIVILIRSQLFLNVILKLEPLLLFYVV